MSGEFVLPVFSGTTIFSVVVLALIAVVSLGAILNNRYSGNHSPSPTAATSHRCLIREFPAPPLFPWQRKPEPEITIIAPAPSDHDRVTSKRDQKLIEMECLRTEVVFLRGIIARREVRARMPLVQFVAMLICGAGLGLILGWMIWHNL